MKPFFSRLEERARAIDSLLCIGLDPHPELVGASTAEAARAWCLALIDATAPVACAYKPNAAFFEAMGAPGWSALKEVIREAGRHAPVILDAKRGDIASTAVAYARAVFHELQADAVTLSPYLGRDALEPFLAEAGRGLFVLVRTSNPGADEIQGARLLGGEPVYALVARRAQAWGASDSLGFVVGATDPAALRAVRGIAPDRWFLAPGVGAQGGGLADTLEAGLRSDGLGLLLTVSRAVAAASDPGAEAARLRAEIHQGRLRRGPAEGLADERTQLAEALVEAGCVQFGAFTLKSGLRSPIYIDLRQLASHPRLLGMAVRAYRLVLDRLQFDCLAAIPYGAMAIGGALALEAGWPMIYPRLEVKAHGTRRRVEGAFARGGTAVVVDDLATTGGSKLEAIEQLREAGLLVKDVVVLIDRESGAAEQLSRAGVRLHAVFSLEELLSGWQQSGRVTADQVIATRRFLQETGSHT